MNYSLSRSLIAIAVTLLSVLPLVFGPVPIVSAAESTASAVNIEQLRSQGLNWLSAQQQEDGSFSSGDMFQVGITALSTLALLENGVPSTDQRVQRAVAWLLQHRQADGGIYDPQEGLANYGTGVTLMVLTHLADTEAQIIANAQAFLIGNQNQDQDSPLSGGFAYGKDDTQRADLANSVLAIEALRSSGVAADHPAMQRALAFVERCQNLSSVNDAPWAGNDGSAVYSPEPLVRSGSHQQEPGEQADGAATGTADGIGSMTYALIKSYLLLDVPADDPRVQTALRWVSANYQFEANPGLAARNKEDGLFYYYLVMGSALDQAGINAITTEKGKADWRQDLLAAIAQRGHSLGDGQENSGMFWINNSRRWGEGIPQLTTAYMLRAIAKIALPAP